MFGHVKNRQSLLGRYAEAITTLDLFIYILKYIVQVLIIEVLVENRTYRGWGARGWAASRNYKQ
jgi:hypothetical protein